MHRRAAGGVEGAACIVLDGREAAGIVGRRAAIDGGDARNRAVDFVGEGAGADRRARASASPPRSLPAAELVA